MLLQRRAAKAVGRSDMPRNPGHGLIDGENMGKGDLRTRRGKIYNGSYGKTRTHRVKKKEGAAAKTAARTRK
jgi:30S ribosomal protein S31